MTSRNEPAKAKAERPSAFPMSLGDFRLQYAQRVFELVGRDEAKAASVLDVKCGELRDLAGICPK